MIGIKRKIKRRVELRVKRRNWKRTYVESRITSNQKYKKIYIRIFDKIKFEKVCKNNWIKKSFSRKSKNLIKRKIYIKNCKKDRKWIKWRDKNWGYWRTI